MKKMKSYVTKGSSLRLFVIAMLALVSLGTKAAVNVTVNTFDNGTIVEKSQSDPDADGNVTVTITATPAEGYQISKGDIVVKATAAPGSSQTRAGATIGIGDRLALTGPDEAQTGATDYTFVVPEGLGALVESATFEQKPQEPQPDPNDHGAGIQDDKTYRISFDKSGTWYLWPSTTTDADGHPYLTTFNDIKAPAVDENGVQYDAFNENYSLWQLKRVEVGEAVYFQLFNVGLQQYVVWSAASGEKAVHMEAEPADVTKTYFRLDGETPNYRLTPSDAAEGTTLNSKAGDKPYLSATNDKEVKPDNNGTYGLMQVIEGSPVWTFTLAEPVVEDQPMEVTATGYSGTYDGQAHGITVEAPEGATVKYGEAEGDYSLDASPTLTNAGETTVYYQATKEGFITVSGSATIAIEKAALTITADAQTKVAGEDEPELTYTVEGLIEGETLTGALTRTEGEEAGEYDILQGTLAATDNYTVTFVGAKLTITAPMSGNLGEEGHETDVTWELKSDAKGPLTLTISGAGATKSLATDETSPWDASADQITSVVIDEGITKIGDGLLDGCANLQSIEIKNEDEVVALGDNALPAVKGLTADVPGHLYNEYRITDGWKGQTISSTTGIEMKGIEFTEKNDYRTFASSDAVRIPSILKAYVATSITANTVNLTEIADGIIPAGVPVLLFTETNDDDVRTSAAKSAGSATQSVLQVAPAGGLEVKLGEVYLLYNDMFYLSQAGTLPEGRAYLPASVLSSTNNARVALSRGMGDSTGDTTGISELTPQATPLSDAWFSLDGRRLGTAPAQKGVYIHNGKLVVIK